MKPQGYKRISQRDEAPQWISRSTVHAPRWTAVTRALGLVAGRARCRPPGCRLPLGSCSTRNIRRRRDTQRAAEPRHYTSRMALMTPASGRIQSRNRCVRVGERAAVGVQGPGRDVTGRHLSHDLGEVVGTAHCGWRRASSRACGTPGPENVTSSRTDVSPST